ncbi:hypothetical protein BJ546DRAFT_7314 [Cryomyces antarcticus]
MRRRYEEVCAVHRSHTQRRITIKELSTARHVLLGCAPSFQTSCASVHRLHSGTDVLRDCDCRVGACSRLGAPYVLPDNTGSSHVRVVVSQMALRSSMSGMKKPNNYNFCFLGRMSAFSSLLRCKCVGTLSVRTSPCGRSQQSLLLDVADASQRKTGRSWFTWKAQASLARLQSSAARQVINYSVPLAILHALRIAKPPCRALGRFLVR